MLRRSLLALLVVAATACTAPRTETPLATATAAPVQRQLLLVEGDAATQLVDLATGKPAATLPGGLLSPTKDLVVRLEAAGGTTVVHGVDVDGLPMLKVEVPGEYHLSSAYGAAPSGFSPNGTWLVLVSRDPSESRFAVIDVARNKLVQTVALGTRFTFDAIHNDGSAMYLIEHPVPGATAYNVRLYDLAAKVLRPDIIFDKTQIAQFDPTVGLMDGTFHVSVAPKAGDWSYGLYMRPNGKPFVHALNVPGRYAQCIVDLAGSWTAASLFSMALSDYGRRLYVVDTAGGSVSAIDALTQKVVRTASFGTRPGTADPRATSAVISPDGTRLYATAARGIAMLQTADLSLRGWAAPDLAARSLALSADGARIYALAGDAVMVVDASSGRVLSQLVSATGARAIHVIRAP
ncbi:MAG TPA: hypothetical protein VFC31_12585 [Candidatus Limnocylindria bacterium]|nr:hypothetical protein [Candidatus Limnocylindria bacterium]